MLSTRDLVLPLTVDQQESSTRINVQYRASLARQLSSIPVKERSDQELP